MWVITIVVLPQFFPGIIYLQNKMELAIALILILFSSVFYEVIKFVYEEKNKNTDWIVKVQLLTSIISLVFFLHFFGRINGPFFVLFLLTIMESALNLNVGFLNIVVGIAVFSTVTEFVWLIWTGEIVFNLYISLQLLIRLVSLFFMRSYGLSLAQRIVSEQESKEKVQESTKRLQEATTELQKANSRLKELSLLKDEFVSIASHELRTPMTTIKSYLWLVLNKAKNLDEKAKRDLQIAYESTERTIILVKDMLTVSRIEGNRLDINFSAFDLKELASQVVNELKVKASERNIKLTIRPFSEDLVINGDRDKIGEVFQNIIGNALKFTPERGNVEVYFQKKNKMVEVSISDDGSGISKKDISKLFQKFSRLGNSLSKMAETPGTGLGLYIAKQIVGLHKGKIWVESIVGKGSTFIFSLPLGERTYVGRK